MHPKNILGSPQINMEDEITKARKSMIELDNGTTACKRHAIIQLTNYNHKIRDKCPSCRQETVIDFKKKYMTCENKECRYFNKFIPSIVKKRKKGN